MASKLLYVFRGHRYMQVVEAMRPDWYEALSDADTLPAASKKRLSKSMASSKAYITTCLQHHKECQVWLGTFNASFSPCTPWNLLLYLFSLCMCVFCNLVVSVAFSGFARMWSAGAAAWGPQSA